MERSSDKRQKKYRNMWRLFCKTPPEQNLTSKSSITFNFASFEGYYRALKNWTGFALLVNVMSFTRHQSSHPFQISATFRSPLFKMPNNACNDVAIAPKKIHLLVFCFRRSSPLSLSIRYLEVGTESYRSVRCSIVRYRRDCDTYNMIDNRKSCS